MLLLRNATIFPQTDEAPFVGDVLCENGVIKEIGSGLLAEGAEVLDLTGLYLLPGLVDCHSHAGLAPDGEVKGIRYSTDTGHPVSPQMDVIYNADPLNPVPSITSLLPGITPRVVIPFSSAWPYTGFRGSAL